VQQFAAEEIGARIQQARKERGLTQEELAEMASFSKRSLQDYETGVTIPYRHMAEISRLLGRSVEWFLYGDEAAETQADLMAKVDRLEGLLEELLRRRETG
jgi:transcriptional regulator with XRE-family HTH domain